MTADGRLHPCKDKHQLMNELEGLHQSWELSYPTNLENLNNCALVIAAMVVVQKQVVNKADIKYCRDLGKYFVHSMNRISKSYKISYIIFDDYSVKATRQQ